MVLELAGKEQIAARRRVWQTLAVHTEEITAFCPACKTIETIFLEDNLLMPTQRFCQRGSQIYHNCGSVRPCCLLGVY
jgi:hypothetical protein